MKKIKVPALVILGLSLSILAYWIFNRGPYCTQRIYYRLKSNTAVTIELQMQDIGARGYNRRIVRVTPGRVQDIVEAVDMDTVDTAFWIFVDEDVNELGLKGP